MSNYVVDPFFQFGGPPAAPTRNSWVELGRLAPISATNLIVVPVATKKYYMVLSYQKKIVATSSSLEISGITTTDYSVRRSIDGGADVGVGSSSLGLCHDGFADPEPLFRVDYIQNVLQFERLGYAHFTAQGGAGAGVVPRRGEIVGKLAELITPITSIALRTPTGGNFQVGTEIVVLGWDPADGLTTTSNFWQELANVTLGAPNATLDSGVINPTKKYLWVQAWLDKTSALTTGLQFNLDGGANYADRISSNGAADVTTPNLTEIGIDSSSANPTLFNGFIINEQNDEKLVIGHIINQSAPGAGNAPDRKEIAGKWTDTASQITSIQFKATGDTFPIGTRIKVWGHD
jgi:hypothetical protein